MPILARPIDPGSLPFQATPARSCARCDFVGQLSDICQLARMHAGLRGLPSCLNGYAYVVAERDVLQELAEVIA